jgi:glycosyltransferase involved in cell wall biosynthesis
MKIGIIIRRLNVKGGTQRQMLSLARELQKLGHKIKIYTFVLDRERCYPELLEYFDVIEKKNTSPQELALAMDNDFDILNPHDPGAERVAIYYKKLMKNIPVVWNMNDTDSLMWSYDKMRGVDENFLKPFWKLLLYRIYDLWNVFRYLQHLDAIIVVDNFNRELTRKYLGLEAITVRSGPDFEHFQYRKRGPPSGRVRLLTSGILLPHRRFEDSIKALQILRDEGIDAVLDIIGDTDNDKKYYEKLKKIVADLNLEERVKFLGRISEAELLEAYKTHDIYVFQHHLQSDGLSPFEALASGLPVIVSKTAGAHEVLEDGKTALFIEPKNPGDIAAKVKMLVQDPKLYSSLSSDGNSFARANFSWPKYAQGVLKVFSKFL